MRHFRWTLFVALVAIASLPAACDSGGGDGNATPDFESMSAALQPFQSCEAVETYLHDVALLEMDTQLSMIANGEYGYGASRDGGVVMDAEMGASSGVPSAAPSGGDQGGNAIGTESGGGSLSEAYSDTNTQEEDVDEADIVKTDGENLYILSGQKLRIVKAAPVEEMALASSIQIDGSPLEMFLSGDRLAVFSQIYRYNERYYGDYATNAAEPAKPQEGMEPGMEPGMDGGMREEPQAPADPYAELLGDLDGEILKITVFDVSDPANVTILRETYLEASYVSARMVGSIAHVVASAYPDLPYFDWYPPYEPNEVDGGSSTGSDGGTPVVVDAGVVEPEPEPVSADVQPTDDPDEPDDAGSYGEQREALTTYQNLYGMSEDEARAAFTEQVQSLTLDDMMPKRIDIVDGEAVTSYLVPCEGFFHPSVSMGSSMLAVFSFDLADDGGAIAATGIIGSSDTVYASSDTLFVATYVYSYRLWQTLAEASPELTASQRTAIHAFDISGGAMPAHYVASGFVDGELLNQFSMSEWNGKLRVATTLHDWFSSGWEMDSTDNLVTVLAQDGDKLVSVGAVTGLGEPGERIYAARFFGDRGFVVTFRNMDPLYTLDMSDPTHPQVVGELHVPGYSSYIHPLGEDHLLTVGRNTQGAGDVRPMATGGPSGGTSTSEAVSEPVQSPEGVKLAIYDVSDLANPQETVDPMIIANSSSEAEYNHKAFNLFGNVLALPIGSYWWWGEGDMPENGLSLFTVDASAGFTALGTVSHADLIPQPMTTEGGAYDRCGMRMPEVRRSVFIGDRVYSISNAGVKANRVAEGLPLLGSVTFPNDDSGYGDGYYWECYMEAGGTTDEPPLDPDDEETPRDE